MQWTISDIKSGFWHLFANVIGGSRFMLVRYWWYRLLKMDVNSMSIKPGVKFSSNKVFIGKRTFINEGCFFENPTAAIKVGNNCSVGMEVLFCTSTHEIGMLEKRAGNLLSKPISVGDGTWIGARVTILPGVTIGNGCIIAAGAVVTKDCSPHGLYAGVPAKRMKDLQCSRIESAS